MKSAMHPEAREEFLAAIDYYNNAVPQRLDCHSLNTAVLSQEPMLFCRFTPSDLARVAHLFKLYAEKTAK